MTNQSQKTLAEYHATYESHEQVAIYYNNLHRIDIHHMSEHACYSTLKIEYPSSRIKLVVDVFIDRSTIDNFRSQTSSACFRERRVEVFLSDFSRVEVMVEEACVLCVCFSRQSCYTIVLIEKVSFA